MTVGVIMGSDSDWPVMSDAVQALREFGVRYEAHVVSAHRTPAGMLRYAEAAAGRGLRVIIAGAGGAAHLPGMVAAATPLPVIGVPVPLRHLDGLDSLLSIVQMPAGVPVAAVSIGGYLPGIKDHVRRALRLGATKEELVEVFQSAYFHTGALTLVHGMVALIDVLKELEDEKKPAVGVGATPAPVTTP